ncbi:hypothetical protein PVK06_025057 [Gossypium arboreum]|uniref:Uncharacterized protein n=1 Tax=Gossypium arboreum TaxID=29729 RepID=A0ABR0PFJ6_GOSAR|nr:hypothetical protein PVK06_025057 [Gossypium arboreum]
MTVDMEIARVDQDNNNANNKSILHPKENAADSHEGQIQCDRPSPIEEAFNTLSKEKSDPICGDDNNKGTDFLCRSKPLGKLSQSSVGNNEELYNKASLQPLQEIVKLSTTGILDAAKHSVVLFKENT